jgi:Fe-S cluster assembly protein SufD
MKIKQMQSDKKNIQWYESKFEAFEKSLNGEKSTAVHALRRGAIRLFSEIGFPTTQQEEWRFTSIAPIMKVEFQPIFIYELNGTTRSDLHPYLIDGAEQLVFVNGMFSSELSHIDSLPPGCTVGSLLETIKNHPEIILPNLATLTKGEENAFIALNTAFLQDGACIIISKDVVVDRPIQLLFVATNCSDAYISQPRNLIVAGRNSKIQILETYVGMAQNAYLTNSVTEIVLEDHAILGHEKIQIESAEAFHIGTTNLRMNGATRYISNVISLGSSIARNNINVVMDAEGSECTLNGLSLGAGKQLIDNHTVIDHAKPHCNSHELYKAILAGASKGVFNGKIFVRKDAQKTDAKQTNKTLLLSDDATINAKPQLEIYADDVKCTHGATIGQLDDEQLFYLRSRGIDLAAARDILTTAFAGDVLNRISHEPFRQQVEQLIHAKMGTGHLKSAVL